MEELVKCKACGKEISKMAPTCPNCGINLPGLYTKCPKCSSMNILSAPKGFSLKKAIAGGLILANPVGLLAGLYGRKKVEFACQECGKRWKPRPIDFREIGDDLERPDIKEIVQKHRDWLNDEPEGKRANFENANLSNIDLRGIEVMGANFATANLDGANLQYANFKESNFCGANLNNANLFRAQISGSNFDGATLVNANLSEAQCRRIDFTKANVEGADFKGADLSDTKFFK